MKEITLLSDDELFHSLGEVVGEQRACMARLVAHLAEIDARRAHLDRGFSSLFGYCVERLRFSEDEACRRILAARLSRRFPQVLGLLETGTVTLTVIGLVKAHLTEDNASELFAGVSRKSSRAAAEWLAARFPRPDVPPTLRKLPRAPATIPAPPRAEATGPLVASIPAPIPSAPLPPPAPPRVEPLSDDRFLLKVTIGRDLRNAINLAKDLLRHRNPDGDLEAVLSVAVQDLIERLEREKFAKTKRPSATPRPSRRAHIANETKRTVVARDGLGCAWTGPDGHRCGNTAFLEFDHVVPEAMGGAGAPENTRLLCRAHNQHAAERVYGREHMDATRVRNSRSLTWCKPGAP